MRVLVVLTWTFFISVLTGYFVSDWALNLLKEGTIGENTFMTISLLTLGFLIFLGGFSTYIAVLEAEK